MLHWLWDKLFPAKCILCGALLDRDELDLCRSCRVDAPEYGCAKRKLRFLDSFTAVWYYEEYVRKSILRYKFHNARSYAAPYARLLSMKLLREHPEGFDLITWVPVSTLRRLKRGYDQVELLANAVAKELGTQPVSTLKKIRNNRPQSRIRGEAERRANVLGVYRAVDPQILSGKRILLLDDILTTGATAGECARVLLTAGAEEVHCAAIAASRKS